MKPIPISDLMDSWFREVPTAKPYPNNQIYRTEYYCDSSDNYCPVREVRIEIKYPEDWGKKLLFKCPICRNLLKFHHFLKTKSVVVKKARK